MAKAFRQHHEAQGNTSAGFGYIYDPEDGTKMRFLSQLLSEVLQDKSKLHQVNTT